jgi:hypothetical protein
MHSDAFLPRCSATACCAMPCRAVHACVLQSQLWHMGDKGSDVTVKLLSVSPTLQCAHHLGLPFQAFSVVPQLNRSA